MKNIFLLILVSTAGACVTMPLSRPVAVSNPAYLADSAPTGKADFNAVVGDLSRDIRVHGVQVSAVPLTGALVETMIREDGFKEGLTRQQIEEKLALAKKEITSNLCFSVQFYSGDYDATIIKYWGAEIVDQQLKVHDLTFANKDAEPLSKTTTNVSSYTSGGYSIGRYYVPQTTNVYSYDETTHSNFGIACLGKKPEFDLTQNFALKLQPRYKRDLKPFYLVWKRQEAPKS